jgi:hypothetical protein
VLLLAHALAALLDERAHEGWHAIGARRSPEIARPVRRRPPDRREIVGSEKSTAEAAARLLDGLQCRRRLRAPKRCGKKSGPVVKSVGGVFVARSRRRSVRRKARRASHSWQQRVVRRSMSRYVVYR